MMVPRRIQGITGGTRRTTDSRPGAFRLLAVGILALVGCASLAFAAPDVHSDGSDGAFNPPAGTTTIDLEAGDDGDLGRDAREWKWCVRSGEVGGRVQVFFGEHCCGQDRAVPQSPIGGAGGLACAGKHHDRGNGQHFREHRCCGRVRTPAGPGGFAGGKGNAGVYSTGCGGFGPGGGGHSATAWGGAGYRWPGEGGTLPGIAYGNDRILPLIGGSGGGGSFSNSGSGGGGGGAILLACAGTFSLSGAVNANGGSGYATPAWWAGGGSGGGIRIIANSVTGVASQLSAGGGYYGTGSVGRIRIEANTIALTGSSIPEYTWLEPLEDDTAVLWPPDTAPRVQVVTVGTQPVPADPLGQFNPPGDVLLVTTDPQPVELETNNVPTNWVVTLRVVRRNGSSETKTAEWVSDDGTFSIWATELSGIPLNEFVAVQARASAPPPP